MAKASDLIRQDGKRTLREIDRDFFETIIRLGGNKAMVVEFFGGSEGRLDQWIKKTYGKNENFANLRNMFGAELFISNRKNLIDRAKYDTKACIYLDDKLSLRYEDKDISEANQLSKAIRVAGKKLHASESDISGYAKAMEEEEDEEDDE